MLQLTVGIVQVVGFPLEEILLVQLLLVLSLIDIVEVKHLEALLDIILRLILAHMVDHFTEIEETSISERIPPNSHLDLSTTL